MNQDLAILGVPLTMLALALLSLWHTRRRAIQLDAELEAHEQAAGVASDKPCCCKRKCKERGARG